MIDTGHRGTRSGDDERGVAPTVGIILLFGMVFVGVALIAVTGMMLLDGLQSSATGDHGEQVLRGVDSDIASDRGSLHLAEHGEYNVSEVGNITITASNRFDKECQLVPDAPIGTLQYVNDDGDTIGYQVGGIFRHTGDGSVVVSNPDFDYYTRSPNGNPVQYLDFSVTSLYGEVGHGEHTATINRSSQGSVDCMDDIRFATQVEINVSGTPYHDGWEQFLSEEFDVDSSANTIEHYSSNQTVIVEASLDRSRPFAQYVDLFPTIYGGIYVDDTTVDQGTITVDGYDSRNGTYAAERSAGNLTDDFYVANTGNRLHVQGDIEGIPVVNGDLRVQSSGSIDPFAFHTGEDDSPPGSDDYENVTLSQPFDEIEDADDEVEEAVTLLGLDSESTTVPPSEIDDAYENDLFYESGDLSLSGYDIDTNETDVNIATEGDLDLSNVNIREDGQVHIYVNGSSIDLTDVQVSGDRAGALWIYGKSGAEVTIDGDFQGVVYAPGADLEIDTNANVWGAVVGGEPDIGDNVDVHFDQSLRSAMAIPDADRTIEIEETVETRDPIDMTFVLDASGSMSENDPDNLREDAVKEVIDALNESHDDRAGVYEFDHRSWEVHPMSGDLTAVRENVETSERYYTDMSEGMDLGLDAYDDDENRTRVMILLSDGKNTINGADQDTRDYATDAAGENVTIYTVGLGDEGDLNEDLLKEVANTTGGKYHHVGNATEIADAFRNVSDSLPDPEKRTITYKQTLSHEANPTTNEHVFTYDHVKVDIEG